MRSEIYLDILFPHLLHVPDRSERPPVVLRRGGAVVRDGEERGSVLLHVEEEVVDAVHEDGDAALVERRVGERAAQLDEEPQEVDGAVHRRHRLRGVLAHHVGVLQSGLSEVTRF